MLRNSPSIKAVVLYISWQNAPQDPARMPTEMVGGDDRMRNALGWMAPFVSPPTLSARGGILGRHIRSVTSLSSRGYYHLIYLRPSRAWLNSRTNAGWWPEHDTRVSPDKHQRVRTPSVARAVPLHYNDFAQNYTQDAFGSRQSYTQVELRRLANLTARHNAKLVVMFQPYPCPAIGQSYLAARRADVAAVVADHQNVVVPDPALFEAWPGRWFTSADHLRTGHERGCVATGRARGRECVRPSRPGTT